METFEQPRRLVHDPHFECDRQVALNSLALARIDAPIQGVIAAFAALPWCFTLQSCYGHFVHADQSHPQNLEPLPEHDVGAVRYRIAYIAFCIEKSSRGQRFLSALEKVAAIDSDFIQFGSPSWFWERHLNSFALQVEPSRFLRCDEANIGYREALHIQHVRGLFFASLVELLGDTAWQQ